jgi:hypothetical protein
MYKIAVLLFRCPRARAEPAPAASASASASAMAMAVAAPAPAGAVVSNTADQFGESTTTPALVSTTTKTFDWRDVGGGAIAKTLEKYTLLAQKRLWIKLTPEHPDLTIELSATTDYDSHRPNSYPVLKSHRMDYVVKVNPIPIQPQPDRKVTVMLMCHSPDMVIRSSMLRKTSESQEGAKGKRKVAKDGNSTRDAVPRVPLIFQSSRFPDAVPVSSSLTLTGGKYDTSEHNGVFIGITPANINNPRFYGYSATSLDHFFLRVQDNKDSSIFGDSRLFKIFARTGEGVLSGDSSRGPPPEGAGGGGPRLGLLVVKERLVRAVVVVRALRQTTAMRETVAGYWSPFRSMKQVMLDQLRRWAVMPLLCLGL